MRRLAGAALLALPLLAAARGPAAGPDFYATRPLFERPFPAQRVPRGLGGLSAAECGRCHGEIYREWQQSVHAQAWKLPTVIPAKRSFASGAKGSACGLGTHSTSPERCAHLPAAGAPD